MKAQNEVFSLHVKSSWASFASIALCAHFYHLPCTQLISHFTAGLFHQK